MAKRKRNYAAEYSRRIAKGLEQGLSHSQARGHRRANEAVTPREKAKRKLADHKLQVGLRILREKGSFSKAAKEAHLSAERLRRYATENGIVEKRRGRWKIKKALQRRVLIFSNGSERTITISTFKSASLIGKYMSAVGRFLTTNDIRHLKPFVGKTVTDINRKTYRLETGPNTLYRLANAGGSSFEDVYRIVV